MNEFLRTWKSNTEYFQLLELMARLSNLFSDSKIPFLHYRVTENLFCKYYNAENLSRSDTAYDAKTSDFGIGIKTFQLECDSSVEKVAEFNSISNQLKQFQGKDLAFQLAIARNERMKLGMRLYGINSGCYHIIGRVKDGLTVFNTIYPFINEQKISSVKDTGKALQFESDGEFYSYNYSKSTLFKRFTIPEEKKEIPVSIIQDPYELLKKLIETKNYEGKFDHIATVQEAIHSGIAAKSNFTEGSDYVYLPLYSIRYNNVQPKSGLNQWNAAGRPRNYDEVYIPIPKKILNKFPDFFPSQSIKFNLKLPNGTSITASVCQGSGKALMSDPNSALGKWLLRDVMQLKEGELVTMEKLNHLGFNSVIIFKETERNYKIDVRYNEA